MNPNPTIGPAAPGGPPAGLYVGRVMHHRLREPRHRFVYRTFSLLVDLDRLAELDRASRLLSVNRANLCSFHERDHGRRDGSPLRSWVDAQLAARGIDVTGGRVLLLCFPRILGYVFNPISIYFAYDEDGRLAAIVHEVNNTFGQQHPYVIPVDPTDAANRVVRQQAAKDFFVSPFIDAEARYHFKLVPPGERVAVVIQQEVDERPQLVATLLGRYQPLDDLSLLGALLRHPLMTIKVTAAIHFEALRLWLKGAVLRSRPVEQGVPNGLQMDRDRR